MMRFIRVVAPWLLFGLALPLACGDGAADAESDADGAGGESDGKGAASGTGGATGTDGGGGLGGTPGSGGKPGSGGSKPVDLPDLDGAQVFRFDAPDRDWLNRTVRLVVDAEALIDAGKMKADMSDVRVYLDEGCLVPVDCFWIQDDARGSAESVIWAAVDFKKDVASKISVAYGEATEGDESEGVNDPSCTFSVFEDYRTPFTSTLTATSLANASTATFTDETGFASYSATSHHAFLTPAYSEGVEVHASFRSNPGNNGGIAFVDGTDDSKWYYTSYSTDRTLSRFVYAPNNSSGSFGINMPGTSFGHLSLGLEPSTESGNDGITMTYACNETDRSCTDTELNLDMYDTHGVTFRVGLGVQGSRLDYEYFFVRYWSKDEPLVRLPSEAVCVR